MYSVRSNRETASDRLRCEPVLDLGREKIDDGVDYYAGMWRGKTRQSRDEWKKCGIGQARLH